MRYRVREGSIASYARVAIISALFWGAIIVTAVTAYPM